MWQSRSLPPGMRLEARSAGDGYRPPPPGAGSSELPSERSPADSETGLKGRGLLEAWGVPERPTGKPVWEAALAEFVPETSSLLCWEQGTPAPEVRLWPIESGSTHSRVHTSRSASAGPRLCLGSPTLPLGGRLAPCVVTEP